MNKFDIKDFFKFIPDRTYIKIHFYLKMGYIPNLESPVTFNEKLQWYKLNYHNPILKSLVDKYEVRNFIESKIGSEFLSKMYGIYDSVEDFLQSDLPERFVVKCTHDSQSTHICRDKKTFDFDAACMDLRRAMQRSWYWQGREWAYKDCVPRVMVEEYLEDGGKFCPDDYKFYCFDGKCELIQFNTGRFDGVPCRYFTPEWKYIADENGVRRECDAVDSPVALKKMIQLSEVLASGFPHVRVDWYCIGERLVFGEMTFYTGSGFDPMDRSRKGRSEPLDVEMGQKMNLRTFG